MSFSRVYRHAVIFGLLLAILATHGLGLHRHGHVPQSDVYVSDHTHKAEFHLASFSTEHTANDTGHNDTSWMEIDLSSSAIAKKFIDSVVFAIFSLVVLLILNWVLQSTSSTFAEHRNNTRPKNLFRITPQLRAPPQ